MNHTLISKINLSNGVVVSEKYSRGGHLHRDPAEGPASISRHEETGNVTWEYFKVNGRFHREDGPAEISRNAEGNPVTETYWFDNTIHRDPKEGPAIIEHRYELGYDGGRELGVLETYMVFGVEYRDPADGPCWIARDDSGKVTAEEFSPAHQAPPSDPRRSRRRGTKPKAYEP